MGTHRSDGSSPLARGLRFANRDTPGRDRIIPARAGFTRGLRCSSGTTRDHPRSRGVYPLQEFKRGMLEGSSPLARGLPRPPAGRAGGFGIIPARAGFTSAIIGLPSASCGSSPLARGLRIRSTRRRRGIGIIPARAGFTRSSCRYPRESRDHPRSRGVYSLAEYKSLHKRGSSPLARGLRLRGCDSQQSVRIIPARAGFTTTPPGTRLGIRDHPRSRGVYGAWKVEHDGHPGSSPLARGLHAASPPGAGGGGIIPARAGFTR